MREILSIWFLLSPIFVFSQIESIGGRIVDIDTNETLPNVLCTLHHSGNAVGIYVFSSADGRFDFHEATIHDSISFALLGYATETIAVSNFPKEGVIRMKSSEFVLKEINVSAPSIQAKGDTLVYNVADFISQKDNYIADVLKRLPGVTVNDNGTISYQGEAINKFYIEGRDLLGGNYTLASNNLDVNAVSAIEIIEHNQHIKSLVGVEASTRAAVNIRLKDKFMVRPFGEASIGGGTTPSYDGKLLTTFLTKGVQSLLTANINNVGDDVLPSLENKIEISSLNTYIPDYVAILREDFFPSPSLPKERYLTNASALVSANILVPVTKHSELKLNISYGADRITKDYDTDQTLMLGEGNTLHLFEYAKGRNHLNKFKAIGSYELNSLSTYLKDEFEFSTSHNRSRSSMLTQSDSVNAYKRILPQLFRNNLSIVYRTKKDQITNFQSNLHVGISRESMDNKYSYGENLQLLERFHANYVNTKNNVGTSFVVFKQRLGIDLSANYQQYKYDNDTGKEYSSLFACSLCPSLNMKWMDNRMNFVLNCGLWYFNLTRGETHHHRENIEFLPSLTLSYNISHKWETRINFARNFNYLEGTSLFVNPFLQTYRSVYVPPEDINHKSDYSLFYTLKYKDIAHLVFCNLSVFYIISRCNYTPMSYNSEEWSVVTTQTTPNNNQMLRIQADISKKFSSICTSISFTPTFTNYHSKIIQQGILSPSTFSTFDIMLSISNSSVKWMDIDYCVKGSLFTNHSDFSSTQTRFNITQKATISFCPIRGFLLKLSGEHFALQQTHGTKNSVFCDIHASYALKRVTFGCALTNLFNVKSYTISAFSSVNEYTQVTPLRNREASVSVGVKF